MVGLFKERQWELKALLIKSQTKNNSLNSSCNLPIRNSNMNRQSHSLRLRKKQLRNYSLSKILQQNRFHNKWRNPITVKCWKQSKNKREKMLSMIKKSNKVRNYFTWSHLLRQHSFVTDPSFSYLNNLSLNKFYIPISIQAKEIKEICFTKESIFKIVNRNKKYQQYKNGFYLWVRMIEFWVWR